MYTISQFSKISRLTTKMLRHYDKIGLLKPCLIDANNSYRYYHSNQIKDIFVINKMKTYGFSLDEIKKILLATDNSHLEGLIKARMNALETETLYKLQILDELRGDYQKLLTGTNIFNRNINFNIVVDEQPMITVLGLRAKISMENIKDLMDKVNENISQHGLKPTGCVTTICYDEDFDPFYADVEVCIPVDRELKTKDICTRDFVGGLHVHTVYKGPYSNLAEGYIALCDWMDREGYEATGAPFEKYIKGYESGCSINEYITEIFFPVVKKI